MNFKSFVSLGNLPFELRPTKRARCCGLRGKGLRLFKENVVLYEFTSLQEIGFSIIIYKIELVVRLLGGLKMVTMISTFKHDFQINLLKFPISNPSSLSQ